MSAPEFNSSLKSERLFTPPPTVSGTKQVSAVLEITLNIVNPKFESHERLKKIVVLDKEWTIENNLLTPSMKIKRNEVERLYKDNYTTWYEKDGHIVS